MIKLVFVATKIMYIVSDFTTILAVGCFVSLFHFIFSSLCPFILILPFIIIKKNMFDENNLLPIRTKKIIRKANCIDMTIYICTLL
jgi:hypothetical protein